MNKKIKKLWLAALRTPSDEGGYLKTKGAMHAVNIQGQDTFCCLGVLANIHELTCPTEPFTVGPGHVTNPFGFNLGPPALHGWAGLEGHQATNLAIVNDRTDTFAEVIAIIETL